MLAKALSPVPKKRWASASTFAIALGRALERLSEDHQPTRSATPDPVKTAEAVLAPTSSIAVEPVPI